MQKHLINQRVGGGGGGLQLHAIQGIRKEVVLDIIRNPKHLSLQNQTQTGTSGISLKSQALENIQNILTTWKGGHLSFCMG